MNVEFVNGCLMVVCVDGRRYVSKTTNTSKFETYGITKLNMEATLSPLIAAKQYTHEFYNNVCVLTFTILANNKRIVTSVTLTEQYQIDIIPSIPENMLGLFQSMQMHIRWLHNRVEQLETETKAYSYNDTQIQGLLHRVEQLESESAANNR